MPRLPASNWAVPRFIVQREGFGWAIHDIGEVFGTEPDKLIHPRHIASFWRRSRAAHIAEQLHLAYHSGLAARSKE